MSEQFQAKVMEGDRGPTIVLSGTVNRAARELLEEAYQQAETIDGEVKLDFKNVEYINSTGIAIIVGILARARAAEREVGAAGLTDHYKEVFEITRLSDFMHIYDDAKPGTRGE